MRGLRNNKRGSTAVFLMMILAAVLGVTAVLFEGSCSAAAKSMSEGLTDLAGRSALSEYHRGLQSDYGLFGLRADEEMIAADLRYYMEQSLSDSEDSGEETVKAVRLLLNGVEADSSEFSLLVPDVMEKQVLDYMKYRAVFSGLDLLKKEEELRSGLDQGTRAGKSEDELRKEAERAEREQEEADRNAIEAEKEEDGGGSGDAAEEREKREQEKKKLKDLIAGQKRRNEGTAGEGGAATGGVADDRVLRNKQEINALPSQLTDFSGVPDLAGLFSGNLQQALTEGRNSVYINEYLLLLFSNYVKDSSDKETFFRNEVEYILCGRSSDGANLRQVRAYLFTLRTSLNLAHIYADPEKRGLTLEAAAAIAPGPGAPAVQLLIASLWAGAESEQDIKLLLEGKKVPFLKGKEDWKTDLDSILAGEAGAPTDGEGRGQDYGDYLRLFLMLQSREIRLVRALDLIQLNLRLRCDREFRAADYCGGFACKAEFRRRTGLTSPFTFSGGYTIEKIQKY